MLVHGCGLCVVLIMAGSGSVAFFVVWVVLLDCSFASSFGLFPLLWFSLLAALLLVCCSVLLALYG